jgi:hypothetical protein
MEMEKLRNKDFRRERGKKTPKQLFINTIKRGKNEEKKLYELY